LGVNIILRHSQYKKKNQENLGVVFIFHAF
jgi:hypothetical protein